MIKGNSKQLAVFKGCELAGRSSRNLAEDIAESRHFRLPHPKGPSTTVVGP